MFTHLIKKQFSQVTQVLKFAQRRVKNELKMKQEKLKENKLYDGLNSENVNDITKKPDTSFYPIQHTPKLLNEDTYIIPYKKKAKNLTPYNFVPPELYTFDPPLPDTPENSKAIDVGIIGPPNSGKSLIFNKIVGANLSAVSSKYNTTFEKIEGIYTDINEKTQICLFDTPGAIRASNRLNSKRIITKSWRVIPECDKVNNKLILIRCCLLLTLLNAWTT
jgi:ribosome biogenesis GTPase A